MTTPGTITPVQNPDASRAWTEEEIRDKFLTLWAATVRYWENEARAPSIREKLEGLAFSLLVIFDGGSVALPGFVVAPAPHEDDRAFLTSQGENYYPEAPEVECDIAGGLHELIHEYLKKAH